MRGHEKELEGNIGGGPGIDVHFWKLSFNFMIGLAGWFNYENEYGGRVTGEFGVFYSF